MQRIAPIEFAAADTSTRQLLDNVSKKMGNVPNIIATMANSVPTTQAYLDFSQALSKGSLSARLREKISLAVGQANECAYCVAAHTSIGKRLGMTESETIDARSAHSDDEKERVALAFSRTIVDQQGSVSDEEVARVFKAGYTEGEIVEIVANVALNIFTNYFNQVAKTALDFPEPRKMPPALSSDAH